jgi:RNA 2',3'-cyclic 3'-phosphodiesterase
MRDGLHWHDRDMTQRLYFALWPDEATREALARSRSGLFPLSGRPVAVQDLHVTVAFLGAVAAARVAALAALAGPLGEDYALRLDRVEWWRKPRVVVASARQTPEGLRGCVDRLWMRLDRLGFAREARPWQPHVTLVRDAQALRDHSRWGSVEWTVNRISLVETAPAPDGSRYRVLSPALSRTTPNAHGATGGP